MQVSIIKAALFTPISGGRWGLPILLWGEPGGAKTSIIEEICANYALRCESLSPGERGEGAFGVVPVPDKTGTILRYPRPDWTEAMDGGGVVFVDEMTTAPPALQAPLLGLLLARRIGGHQFGPRVRVLGAANPPELAAGGFDLASSVANRLGHIDWGAPTIEEHSAYMMRGESGGDTKRVKEDAAVVEETRVMSRWAEPWARARGLETAFLTRRPNLKNVCPPAGDPKASRGWPSDRSWEHAARALASADVHGLSATDKERFVESFVGSGAAEELFTFAAANDLPDPAAVLDGQERFTHSSARLDRTAALLNGCAALVTPTSAPKRKERADALWRVLGELSASKSDLDILAPCAQAIVRAGLHSMASATKVLASMHSVLKAANVKEDA